MGMRVITGQFKILELEIKDRFDIWIDLHCRQRAYVARQLQFDLFKMVGVKMRIAQRMDEIAKA